MFLLISISHLKRLFIGVVDQVKVLKKQLASRSVCLFALLLHRRVASGGAGGAMPPRFSFLPPHGIFFAKSCFFWPEKTLKFVISVRKSLRISAKTFFFWRSPVSSGKKTLKFRPEKAFGNRRKHLPPPPPILIFPPDLAKLATPLLLQATY